MNEIAGIPYCEAHFEKDGRLEHQSDLKLPAEVTDLLVISHGWNNNDADARELYRKFFDSFAAVARPSDLAGRHCAILGVLWPSKKFDEMVAVSGAPGAAEGSAALRAADQPSREALQSRIELMKNFFTEPAQHQTLEAAKALLPDLEEKGSVREEFAKMIRSLLDPAAAEHGDASDTFFREDGNELMKRLKIDQDDLGDDVIGSGGTASIPLGVGSLHSDDGGAAGLAAFFSGFKAAAMNVLNFTTYFEMKTRAGNVGRHGVAPLIDQLAKQVESVHLIGHSFGGRVVTAAAANSRTDKIKSISLLQTAFSHNGFSKGRQGFFRSVVDQQRVHGPILVTHTKNDKAVGLAYPTASRINGDTTAAFGDENDKFGGLGRNGAQQMEHGEVSKGSLQAADASYQFSRGVFFNLESSDFVKGHGDITGQEVAHAVRAAIAG